MPDLLRMRSASHLGKFGQNLCAAVPPGVDLEPAAYAGIAAIALQGIRLARVSLGERVLVIGLGLVGQITVALLKAHGCYVIGTDPESARLQRAADLGADRADVSLSTEAITAFSKGLGVDAAIITAATASNQPIESAAAACRKQPT